MTEETKVCTRCQKEKPVSEFPPAQRNRKTRSAYGYYCRECCNEVNLKSYHENHVPKQREPTIIDWRVSDRLKRYMLERGWNAAYLGYVMGVHRNEASYYLRQMAVPSQKRLLALREDGGAMRRLCDELLVIIYGRRTFYMRSYIDGRRIKVRV